MKQERQKVNNFQQLKELYGRSDLTRAVKPGHEPKGIKPKENPENAARRDADE